jgi:hypothetical protein
VRSPIHSETSVARFRFQAHHDDARRLMDAKEQAPIAGAEAAARRIPAQ